MKLVFCLLIAVLVAQTFAVSCAAAHYCMGCHATTANTCLSCFNWGSGSVGVRALVSSSCTTAMTTTKVTDCKWYSGTNNGTTQDVNNCQMCNKDYLNKNASTAVPTCSNTALNTTTCSAKVSNCEQTVCYTANGTTYTLACGMCKKNYAGSGTATANAGYASCSTSGVITNCEYHYYTGSALGCYSCKSNYAVASTSTTCTAYTTDSNCRQLHSTGSCGYCWHSYYWNVSTCKLTAFVTILSTTALAILAYVM